MGAVSCAICGTTTLAREKPPRFTLREAWRQAGGWGAIPAVAIVHVRCDEQEQARLTSGKLTLDQLFIAV
jgi:hypothetical protein